MNRRPTPETDEQRKIDNGDTAPLLEFAEGLESERDELRADLEFRRGLFKLQEEQLNEVRAERDEWKAKFIQQNKDLGCEMMDPGGTIWDYAKNLQKDNEALKEQLDAAIMLGKMQERRHQRELEQVREQYRLSSVCRKLLEENKQLK